MQSTITPGNANPTPAQRQWTWAHAAIFLVAANLPGIVSGWREKLFPGFLEPPLRPPGILFRFIWFALNLCTLAAALRILNNRALPDRMFNLGLQAVFWTTFAIFPLFYFGLSSPIIGSALTLIIFGVAFAQVVSLWGADRKAAILMVPLACWGAFAGFYASIWQVMFNPDPFLGVPPLNTLWGLNL